MGPASSPRTESGSDVRGRGGGDLRSSEEGLPEVSGEADGSTMRPSVTRSPGWVDIRSSDDADDICAFLGLLLVMEAGSVEDVGATKAEHNMKPSLLFFWWWPEEVRITERTAAAAYRTMMTVWLLQFTGVSGVF